MATQDTNKKIGASGVFRTKQFVVMKGALEPVGFIQGLEYNDAGSLIAAYVWWGKNLGLRKHNPDDLEFAEKK